MGPPRGPRKARARGLRPGPAWRGAPATARIPVGMNEADRNATAWAAAAIAHQWRRATVGAVAALKGDASTRRFWRVALGSRPRRAPATAIVVALGPDDLPPYAKALGMYSGRRAEPPWISVHRFLKSLGAPVPEVYGWSPGERMLLVEDVGATPLFAAARANPSQAADLYREAVRELLRLHAEGTARRDSRCVAFEAAYDERLFAWELGEFARYGLAAVAPEAGADQLGAELADLAARLGRLPRVFSHRDYHGNNLFLQDGERIRILDFQDALMAPAAQDLAVLLTTRDTSELISAAAERRLLDFYFTGLLRRGAPSLGQKDFLESYRLCVLQHALKCIGRFVHLEREGRPDYAPYVAPALAQARRMLAELEGEFPRLGQALGPEPDRRMNLP